MSLEEVCDAIIQLLPSSENNLGFVSPTHFVVHMISIVEELRKRGSNPTIVYNTNGYELPETIRSLEGLVDVWLPDFKYSDDDLAEALSQAPDYSQYALRSIKEMVHQAGTTLHTDDLGIARRGIIIRHLVLPGFADKSIGVLRLISENLSPNLHISLMSQYYPPDNPAFAHSVTGKEEKNRRFETATKEQNQSLTRTFPDKVGSVAAKIADHRSLTRTITREEYETVVDSFHAFDFSRGWVQDFESQRTYRPDFSKGNPFER